MQICPGEVLARASLGWSSEIATEEAMTRNDFFYQRNTYSDHGISKTTDLHDFCVL